MVINISMYSDDKNREEVQYLANRLLELKNDRPAELKIAFYTGFDKRERKRESKARKHKSSTKPVFPASLFKSE